MNQTKDVPPYHTDPREDCLECKRILEEQAAALRLAHEWGRPLTDEERDTVAREYARKP